MRTKKLLSWETVANLLNRLHLGVCEYETKYKKSVHDYCPFVFYRYFCGDLHNGWRGSSPVSGHLLCLQNCRKIAALYPRVEKLMLSLPSIGVGQRERQSRFSLPKTSLRPTMMKTKDLFSWATVARLLNALPLGVCECRTVQDAKDYVKAFVVLTAVFLLAGLEEGGAL